MDEPIIYRILIYVFCIFIFVAIVAFSKWRELSQERKLRDLVAWSVNGGDGIPLWAEISNAQIKLKLPKEYCLAGDDDWSYVREIIEEYRQDLMLSFFKGHLIVIKSKYAISGECYFMASLYAFLCKHQCDHDFLRHDMHKERLEYQRYGDWGDPLFDAKYEQTDFAIVFHKMHYITYMYCKGDERLKGFIPAWNEKNLKEILDTKQIHISRY